MTIKTSLKRYLLSLFLSGFLVSGLSFAQVDKLTTEKDLIAVLSTDSPLADKAIACKRLALYGSEECVAKVAPLLADEKLSSWARIALEAIPGPKADEALREAATKLEGRVLIGVVNSLGVRRDVASTEVLAKLMTNPNDDVASAAAVSLGHIGTEEATTLLSQKLNNSSDAVRNAIAEGLILCAEKSMLAGKLPRATRVYEMVRTAKVPQQRVIEATRGSILARKADGIPMLVEELKASEVYRFQLGLRVARELDVPAVDNALARLLSVLPEERAALLLTAMADRPKTVNLEAIVKALGSSSKPIKLAAATALGKVGTVECIDPLLAFGASGDAELIAAAVGALSQVPDEAVGKSLASRLDDFDGPELMMAIQAVGQRGIAAEESVVKALENSNAGVRTAAFAALGDTLGPDKLSILIGQFLKPNFESDSEVAYKALLAAAIRMPDRDRCATELSAAYSKAPAALKVKALEILGLVGGAQALKTVGEAAASTEESVKDAATKVLGNWMTADAAPVLLQLAKSLPSDKYQVRTVRAYLRIARQFDMSSDERLAMSKVGVTIAKQPDEKKLVLDSLKRNPRLETLEMAVAMSSSEGVGELAATTAKEIAGKIQGQDAKVQEILSKLSK
ncbi:MAG: HEAT repeat domain-containing protein [Pirellula sp.]|nr:HEAT repeat domain-containing protein [Pirellula sp.]